MKTKPLSLVAALLLATLGGVMIAQGEHVVMGIILVPFSYGVAADYFFNNNEDDDLETEPIKLPKRKGA